MKFPTLTEMFEARGRFGLSPEQAATQDELREGFEGPGFGGAVVFPWFRESRGMSATGTTTITGDQGGQTIAHAVPEIGTSLKANLTLLQLGARTMVGLRPNIGLPRAKPGVSAVWLSENASATDGSELFTLLNLTPKRIIATRDVSDQMFKQVDNLEAYFLDEAMSAISAEVERVAIAGTGSSNQPLGILNTTGIGSVAGGTNGAAPTLANLCDLEYAVTGTAKADRGKCAWLVSPYVRRKLRQTASNGSGSPTIWNPSDAYNLLGHPAGVTPNVPDTLTKGTASGVCSSIIFGEMSELFLAFWGPGMAIEVTRSSAGAKAGLSTVIVTAYVDCGGRSPEAFAAMNDALAA